MLDLLLEYVDVAMTKHSPKHGKVEELEKYYQDVVPVCVDYCLALNMMWVLISFVKQYVALFYEILMMLIVLMQPSFRGTFQGHTVW